MTPGEIAVIGKMEGDLINISNVNLFLLFHILFQKKMISYAEFQDAISTAREVFPQSERLQNHFDRLERTYQPGPYSRPPDRF